MTRSTLDISPDERASLCWAIVASTMSNEVLGLDLNDQQGNTKASHVSYHGLSSVFFSID